MNKLPPFWIVRNSNSQKFKDTVIAYINETYNKHLTGNGWKFFGYDGINTYGDSIKMFKNNPTLLTLEQFIEMTEEGTVKNTTSEKIKEIIEIKEAENKESNEIVNRMCGERDLINEKIQFYYDTIRRNEYDIKKLKELLILK